MGHSWRSRAVWASAVLPLVAMLGVAPSAAADPVGSGTATAWGANLTVAGNPLILDRAGLEEASLADPDPEVDPFVLIPAAPLAVSGTADGEAAVHSASDLDSTLEQETQPVEGPYNARAVGTVEDAQVLLGVPGEGQELISATAVRAEAVAVCKGGTVTYSANSEIIDLNIAGNDVPLNGPISELLDALNDALEPLAQVVDLGVNEVSEDGRSVTALRVTVLSAAGQDPLAEVLLGHAEIGPTTCGGAGEVPECNDTVDNDNDALIDTADPGCHTDGDATNPETFDPTDDSEGDGPACADTVDNDGDGKVDAADPGCHSDGDADNPGSYVAGDTDETDTQVAGAALPRTGGESLPLTGAAVPTALAAALAAGALGLLALRRRLA